MARRCSISQSPWALALAFVAGLGHALAFAPWNQPWLQIAALAALFALALRAPSARRAAALGGVFGLGWFGLGVSWVYVSLHNYGGLMAPVAAMATAGLVAFLSFYPALALGVAARFVPDQRWRAGLGLPAAWAASEWLRGTLLTGFPWLASGYAHTDGWLAGYAPVLGVYGIGLIAALIAGALAGMTQAPRARGLAVAIVLVLAGGAALKAIEWSQPAGTLSVRLVQGDIGQDEKFTAAGMRRGFETYYDLMRLPPAVNTPAPQLVVLPESVFPVPLAYVPALYREAIEAYAREREAGVIFGVFLEPKPEQYYNSAVGVTPAGTPLSYSKRHLVPFGEFIPPGFRWFVDMMDIPIGDQQRGAAYQRPMDLAGQRVAVNICYEDLFGEEIIAAWADPAVAPTVLVNLSNLAWFDDSLALPQHLQISRMRSLETARPMLRSTNTGATAVIDAQGRVQSVLPFMSQGVLDATVQATSGVTPYVRIGNAGALALIGFALGLALVLGRRGARAA
ncbi:MAG: apolipoprotein N-acyltransferase [Burkholderiaceae bacterium]